MGSARGISFRQPPTKVALLSNGTEANKTEAIKEAHKSCPNITISFTGNVEGLDIHEDNRRSYAKVLGSVVLKMLEGVSEVVTDLKDAYLGNFYGVWA